ncbi:CHRD domain-containing protein [Flavobacterium fluvii]|uniref:CHRD domain-containing protein n=1 Tax=Flavobacterium fluvii TaxID=468056 RepID=A0A1M5H2B6_9FLAO|nr:CHRD domain-containing protein [Flavobacterium fluvii]SHG10074.1 CHRD domain-containing protein [Flavobacterium fluvii]
MRHFIRILAILFISMGIVSCNDDDDPAPNPNVTFTATLNGASEVPANTSTATGTATLTYNTMTKIFTITVNHTISAPTNGHIHKGAVGVSGPPVFPFATFTSPINYTSTALDAGQEADLYAGLYYVNIHTAAFTGGEIRGQLTKQTSSGGGGGGY